jgi:hypothetical protein
VRAYAHFPQDWRFGQINVPLEQSLSQMHSPASSIRVLTVACGGRTPQPSPVRTTNAARGFHASSGIPIHRSIEAGDAVQLAPIRTTNAE